MKCPNDNTEMEKGWLSQGAFWKKGELPRKGFFAKNPPRVFAWKCPKCNNVLFSSEA